MSQVGHADSNMTLDVYAQLEQRIEWSHGTEFDRLVRNARGASRRPFGHAGRTLRRTYISIARVAKNFDVKWVMSQVGHADSKMTLDVYAQLEQRIERSHGTEFDRLVRNAREQLHGSPTRVPDEGVLAPKWHQPPEVAHERSAPPAPEREPSDLQGPLGSGETRTRTGDTTIFSRVLYQLSYLAATDKASGPRTATRGAGRPGGRPPARRRSTPRNAGGGPRRSPSIQPIPAAGRRSRARPPTPRSSLPRGA
jgi:hypothetical protein